jgi:hypothetical protein
MRATTQDWKQGYGLGYRAATEIRSTHGQAHVNVNARALRLSAGDDWDRGYARGYEDARDRKANRYPLVDSAKGE